MDIIEYSRRLQELYTDMKIIYLTELNDSIFEVFYSTPTYVLSKPLNKEHVKKAVKKALHELNVSKEKNFTIINTCSGLHFLFLQLFHRLHLKAKNQFTFQMEFGLIFTIINDLKEIKKSM